MARYELNYAGEHRTQFIGIKLTPTERATLEAEAAAAGAPLSTYVRELCIGRSAPVVASTRRNPQAKALAFELNAIGTNLNQLTYRANVTGDMPAEEALFETLDMIKAAIARVIAL